MNVVSLSARATAVVLSALLWASCATDFPGDPPDLDNLEYPVGMALHPSGDTLYVVNANFDLKYRPQDGGTLSVIDLESLTVLPEQTRTMGSFATTVRLNHDASRGYVTVRGDSSVTWFDLSEDGRRLSCPLAPNSVDLGKCKFAVPSEPTGLAYSRGHRTQALLDANGRPLLDNDGRPRLIEQDFDLLAIAHLRDGLVSVATVGDTTGTEKPAFSIASATLVDGPSDIALQSGERFFVTGRVASSLVAFRPAIGADAQVLGIYLDAILQVPTPFSSHQGRSLLFSQDKDRLYLTNQSPNSLLVFDTSEGDNDAVSGTVNHIIDMLDMPQGPNRMAWVSTGEKDLLYITSFSDDAVAIVDPAIPAIVGRVEVGEGPFDILVDQTKRRQAYVSNFAEHSVSVLDLSDPLHPVETHVIGGLQ